MHLPLIRKHRATIDNLKSVSDMDDIFLLRYCLEYDSESEMKEKLESNLKWRSENKAICEGAAAAIEAAQSGGSWDNSAVRDAAPHASTINQYITPSQICTTTSSTGDLVYCVRAAKIDDKALMSKVSVEEMTEFFVYCREVLNVVAAQRSLATDKLVKVVTANDLAGVGLKGDADFRKALSAGSKQANELYPSLNGPTLLLNLPRLLGALAKLFTPLFPKAVQKKLKFEQGPLKDMINLDDVLSAGEYKSTNIFCIR